MAFIDTAAKLAQGLAGASYNPSAQQEVGQWQAERAQQRNAPGQMALQSLQEALRADQTRLALYANPDNPEQALPGKEAEYNAVHERMANTIGQILGLFNQTPQGANPVEAGVGNLLDKLHITNHLKNHVAEVRAANAAKYAGQNQAQASEYGAGALPFAMTPQGQTEAAKSAAAQALELQRAKSAQEIERERAASALAVANARKPANKGYKAMEQGGVAYGVVDQDTGKQYLPSQLGKDGDAPPEAKQIWATILQAQAGKQADIDKRDRLAAQRLAATLGNMGTWSIAEGGNGETVLYNSKTGQTKDAAPGLHKSGYFAKQIAPIQAAALNITDYMKNGVFDGPGDLALQHEFFTATQPATGFRMTKVQQDILQDSRSWLDSWKAKALHATTGQWFTKDQRKQLADAAQQAIAAKIKVMEGTESPVPEGSKTKSIKAKANSARSGEKSSGFNWNQYPTQ